MINPSPHRSHFVVSAGRISWSVLVSFRFLIPTPTPIPTRGPLNHRHASRSLKLTSSVVLDKWQIQAHLYKSLGSQFQKFIENFLYQGLFKPILYSTLNCSNYLLPTKGRLAIYLCHAQPSSTKTKPNVGLLVILIMKCSIPQSTPFTFSTIIQDLVGLTTLDHLIHSNKNGLFT